MNKANYFIYNFYTLVEGIAIMVIYSFVLETKRQKLMAICFVATYSIGFLILALLGKMNNHNYLLVTVEAVIVILLSIVFYFRLINETKTPNLTDHYLFWLNTAFMIYFSGCLFLFVAENFVFNSKSRELRFLWILHNFFNIVYNILLAKSVYTWKKMKQ